MKLIEAAQQREKGQILRWTHYFEAYDFHFQGLKPKRLLEIGVMGGGSLWMWKRYFPGAEIVGVDIDEKCRQWEDEVKGVKVFVGDQGDVGFLKNLNEIVGPFDIIIDDGSHKMDDQQTSLALLFPTMPDGGIYVIEDLHTSYWPTWGGSVIGGNTTLSFLKNIIGFIHNWAKRSHEAQTSNDYLVPDNYWEKNVSSMHFYDSICFIYKTGHGQNKLGEGGEWHG